MKTGQGRHRTSTAWSERHASTMTNKLRMRRFPLPPSLPPSLSFLPCFKATFIPVSSEAAWSGLVPSSLRDGQLCDWMRACMRVCVRVCAFECFYQIFFHLFLPKPVTHYHSNQTCFYLFRSLQEETPVLPFLSFTQRNILSFLQRLAVHLLAF